MVSEALIPNDEVSLIKRALLCELADGPRSATEVSERLGLCPANSEAVIDALAGEGELVRCGSWLVNAGEVNRLVERFDNMKWQTLVPITAVVFTLVLGVLACAQVLVSVG